ncbi:uncharacterized protein LOC112575118 [Pomacea canaliculata]|uniref:uncharacterized protein LOC112575118 n=1 Tax=Pomacea canaliculata TaxID=400727 RepID=UPI000D731C37|nr:uncharacterized protein LOC112575118 [Pomacea canaliculata]
MVREPLHTRFLTWPAYLLFIETTLVIVILRLLSSFSSAHPPRDGSVTCHVPSVGPMQNTSLTCHFPENVSETRKTVVIYFYKPENGQEQKDADDVLECWWLAGKKTCLVQSGYNFNGMISHELTLEIPQASAKFTGKYACLISQINHHDNNACEFRIKQEVRCDIPSVISNSSATLTCYFPDYLNKTREDFAIYHHSDVITRCKQKAEVFNCHTGRGYVFDGEITDHVTVRIPSASDEHEGTYSCRIAGKKYENCSFALNKELPSPLNTSTANDTEHIPLMCRLSVTVIGSSRRWNFSAVHVDVDDNKDTGVVTLTWKNDYYDRNLASGYEIKDLIITVPQHLGVENAVYPCSLILSSDMSKIEPTEPSANKGR